MRIELLEMYKKRYEFLKVKVTCKCNEMKGEKNVIDGK